MTPRPPSRRGRGSSNLRARPKSQSGSACVPSPSRCSLIQRVTTCGRNRPRRFHGLLGEEIGHPLLERATEPRPDRNVEPLLGAVQDRSRRELFRHASQDRLPLRAADLCPPGSAITYSAKSSSRYGTRTSRETAMLMRSTLGSRSPGRKRARSVIRRAFTGSLPRSAPTPGEAGVGFEERVLRQEAARRPVRRSPRRSGRATSRACRARPDGIERRARIRSETGRPVAVNARGARDARRRRCCRGRRRSAGASSRRTASSAPSPDNATVTLSRAKRETYQVGIAVAIPERSVEARKDRIEIGGDGAGVHRKLAMNGAQAFRDPGGVGSFTHRPVAARNRPRRFPDRPILLFTHQGREGRKSRPPERKTPTGTSATSCRLTA